ncbi:hypothetical protein [Streptomyces sp. CB02400]|uniref:hypothetical protein n=1 Tax=unclassified Streptomyces TaxID=2593676 RepID=UPI000A6E74B4|nr:hypothetical protein [Streptomyces sp. CB02400]
MSHTVAFVVPPLNGCVVLVMDATTGAGRSVATRLSAAGAAVAVVGAGHPGRDDDAATNAAFLCKELAGIGLVALPYQVDVTRPETLRALPGQIAGDLGPVAACVVVIPSGPGSGDLARDFRAVSAVVAAALPAGAEHIEIDPEHDGAGHERAAQSVADRLIERFTRSHESH